MKFNAGSRDGAVGLRFEHRVAMDGSERQWHESETSITNEYKRYANDVCGRVPVRQGKAARVALVRAPSVTAVQTSRKRVFRFGRGKNKKQLITNKYFEP